MIKFYVSDDQEIYKTDEASNWYVFRHGRWESQNHVTKPEWLISEHETLASARKFALKEWIKDFEKFKVEALPEGFGPENIYYDKGDEDAEFWSEGFLYPLLGKEDARSLLGCLRRLKDISMVYR